MNSESVCEVVEVCPHCHQKIRLKRKVGLSRNRINYLWKFYNLQQEKGKGYVETKDVYQGIKYPGSNTAELANLKYLGALRHHPNSPMEELHRSGKWSITEAGFNFLFRGGVLPSFVVVWEQEIYSAGDGVRIDDPSLKWEKEEDIWLQIKSGVEAQRGEVVFEDCGGWKDKRELL